MAKRGLCIFLAVLTLFALAVPAFAAGSSAKLAAPTVTISKASNGIKVSWNKVTGSPRYMVYYKENGGSWKRIGTTASTTYTRKAANLKNGVTYQFTVRCCANDKKTLLGPYKASNSLKYTVTLAAPTVNIAQVSNGIKVSWNAVSGSPRYMVYYKENNGGWTRIGTTTSTTYTRKAANLKNGATYQFTVRCCANDKKTLLGPYKASNSIIYKQQAQFKIGAYQDTRDNYETYALFVTNVTDSTITFSVFAYRWTSIINVTGKISGNKVTFANENVEGYLTLSDNGKIVMTLTSANDMYIGKGVFTYKYFGTAMDYWSYYDRLQLLRNDDTYGWRRRSDAHQWESWNCTYDDIFLRFFDDGTFTYWLGTYDALMYEDFEKFRGTYEVKETVDDRNQMITKLYLNGDEYELVLAGTFTMDIDATGEYAVDLSGDYIIETSDKYIGLNRYY